MCYNFKYAALGILKIGLVLFAANCFLGTDRLWNLVDYDAISEADAIAQAKEVEIAMPTQIQLKETGEKVTLKKGETVKVLARYRDFMTPLVRTGDYLPTYEFVVMRSDSSIGKGVLPEAIVGATAIVKDGDKKNELEITALKPSKKVRYERSGTKHDSEFGFWVCLSDGSRLAFEELRWKSMRPTQYNARGIWASSDSATLRNRLKDMSDTKVTFTGPIAVNDRLPVLGNRGTGYYKPALGLLCSLRMKKWSASGVAGMIEGFLFLIYVFSLPFLIHKTVFHLPGKNWFIIAVSWLVMIGMIYLWCRWVTGFTINLFFAFVGLVLTFTIRDDVESSRCKCCGGVDCLESIDGTPVRTHTWWTDWFSDSRKIGTVTRSWRNEYGTTGSHTYDVYRKGKRRENKTEKTWGEAYHCRKCGASYEYIRHETFTNDSEFHYTESEADAKRKAMK